MVLLLTNIPCGGKMYNKYEKSYFLDVIITPKGEIMEKDKLVGVAKVGEKGQIVIPKDMREMFGIGAGDTVVILADKEKGIAIVKSGFIEDNLKVF